MISWLPLLFACSPDGPGANGPTDTGSPADDAAAVQPQWAAEEAVAALQAALDEGLPQPWVARDAFLGLIEEGQDETCPGTTDFDGANPLGCTSEAGYLYAGISEYREDDNGWSLGGDFEIREPDGSALHGAGHLFLHADGPGMMTEFSGHWSHDGGEDWLDPGRSGMFAAMLGGSRAELSGGLDLGGTYVHFAEVVIEQEPVATMTGELGVRDAAGAWWWLELGEDGCGSLTFGHEDHGTACVELMGPIGTWIEGLVQ